MKKRLIQRTRKSTTPKASYPTEEEFEGNRRAFLARFGATVLGAGTLAAGLAGCGDGRAVGAKKKMERYGDGDHNYDSRSWR